MNCQAYGVLGQSCEKGKWLCNVSKDVLGELNIFGELWS